MTLICVKIWTDLALNCWGYIVHKSNKNTLQFYALHNCDLYKDQLELAKIKAF